VQPHRDEDTATKVHGGVVVDGAGGEGGAGAGVDGDTRRAGDGFDVVGEGAVVEGARGAVEHAQADAAVVDEEGRVGVDMRGAADKMRGGQ